MKHRADAVQLSMNQGRWMGYTERPQPGSSSVVNYGELIYVAESLKRQNVI